MDRATFEKLLVLTILLLLPCVFYKNNDKPSHPGKDVIASSVNSNASESQAPSPVQPVSTVQAHQNAYPVSSYDQSQPPINPQMPPEIDVRYEHNKSGYQNVSYNTPAPNTQAQITPIEGEGYIQTNNYANARLNYYYYYPSSFAANNGQRYPLIVAVPGLSGNGKSFVSQEMKDFAMREGFGIVAPTFIEDADNFEAQKSYQYPSAWSGAAMMKILSDLESKGLKYSKLYMLGFSAGAQFVSRFSFIYPQSVAACAINGSGAKVWPQSNNGVHYYIAVGNQDEEIRKQNAQIFYNEAIKLGIPAVYKQYNVGHGYTTEQISDELNFFKKVKGS